MIVSHLTYKYDLNKRNGYKTSQTDDMAFLLRQFVKHTKQHHEYVCHGLKNIVDRYESIIYNAEPIQMSTSGLASPNTQTTLKLSPNAKITGTFTIHHNRTNLDAFFGLSEIMKEDVVIDYDEYLAAYRGDNLDGLIHSKLGYKLGNGFAKCGQYYIDSIQYTDTIVGIQPLAMIVPSLDEIERGWLYFRNVTNVSKGTLKYQDLRTTLKLQSSNHAFIEDGTAYINLLLRRPLHHYNKKHEEEYHVD